MDRNHQKREELNERKPRNNHTQIKGKQTEIFWEDVLYLYFYVAEESQFM